MRKLSVVATVPWSDGNGGPAGEADAPVEVRRPAFTCPVRHQFSVAISAAVPVPLEWECRQHGKVSVLTDPDGGTEDLGFERARDPRDRASSMTKTHFDRLLERRTREELQVLLDEQLELLRERRSALPAA